MFEKLEAYLKSHHYDGVVEGNCSEAPEQLKSLQRLVSYPWVGKILEIGFNGGHSSDLFLQTKPGTTVLSFELGKHDASRVAKHYIDETYPGRHKIILGDSQEKVPQYHAYHPFEKYDLIFIDGGHGMPLSKNDLINSKPYAHANTIVIMDDYTDGKNYRSWNGGPNQAWNEAVQEGIVTQTGFEVYSPGKGMVWGRYNLS